MVTPRRRIQPQVENTDMYRWSSTKIWSRSTASRSRYSGRSWWATVTTRAWSPATWPSSAIVTLSRNRRCNRVETTRNSQVSMAEAPSPIAATITRRSSSFTAPLPSSASQRAISASGSAARRFSTNAVTSSRGSCW